MELYPWNMAVSQNETGQNKTQKDHFFHKLIWVLLHVFIRFISLLVPEFVNAYILEGSMHMFLKMGQIFGD